MPTRGQDAHADVIRLDGNNLSLAVPHKNYHHEDRGGCLAEDENEMVVLSAGRERMGRLGGEAVTQMRQTTTFHLDHHDDDSHSGAETSSLETKDTPSPANCMSFLFFSFLFLQIFSVGGGFP